MLTSQKITSTESVLFPRLDILYGAAFPWHEQREKEAKAAAIADPRYALEGWFDGDRFVGLSGCWTFNNYLYIEHLAVDDALRSQGYGKRLLDCILARQPLTILEIDPLTSEVARKRLRFYEKTGFHANSWAHEHPAYHQGSGGHALIVLSYPRLIDDEEYALFSQDLRQVVMAW